MAMRMSGLMSGMDTESIVQQLVEAKSVKVTTAKKAQTKLSWKQDAWKDLNTKLKNLQSKFLSNMRFSTSYTRKVTKVSNPNAVSVITGENAVNGVQELQVNQLAKTAYLTGGEVKAKDSSDVTAMTEICTLDGFSGDGKINITVGGTSVDIEIKGRRKDTNNNEIEGSGTTISDVLSQLKNAGLNASFDAKWGRFSISSKESGAANDFSITALDQGGLDALSAMKLQVSLDKDEATLKDYQKYAGYFRAAADKTAFAAIPEVKDMIDKDVASRTEAYLNQYKSLAASVTSKDAEIQKLNEQLNAPDSPLTEDDKKAIQDKIAELNNSITDLNNQMNKVKEYVDITETPAATAGGEPTYTAKAKPELEDEVKDRYYDKAAMADSLLNADGTPKDTTGSGATKVNGQNAEIILNGATYENSNNTFEINGLTFTALAETDPKAPITVTTEQDVDGIYDMVKNFLKEYNSIINEMDKLYNADAAKDYEPLSDEEKDVMSEKDIEKYEQKIKDSLLRRDENLSSVSSGLRDVMAAGIEVNGKTMHLFDFGIETLSYFVAPDNEKNAYHIAGDADDGYTSGNEDKLKTMIANDPDTVIDFFTKLSQNLYGKMSDMSKSVDGYRSFGNFYDDKKMKSDYDDYTSKIATLEQKLNDYEDSWYKKFSAMETAMAKMQQNANAVTSLLGG